MQLVLVKLVYPFGIAVPAGRAFPVHVGEGFTTIVVRAGTGRNITIYHEVPEDPVTASGERLWYRSTAVSGDKQAINRVLRFNDRGDPFLEEVSDQLAYTLFDVVFETPSKVAEPLTEDAARRLEAEAVARVRVFVAAYAQLSGDIDLFLPDPDDSPGSVIDLADDYSVAEDGGIHAHFRRVSHHIRWSRTKVQGLLKEHLAPEKLQAFAEQLKRGGQIPLYVELFVEARSLPSLSMIDETPTPRKLV